MNLGLTQHDWKLFDELLVKANAEQRRVMYQRIIDKDLSLQAEQDAFDCAFMESQEMAWEMRQ